MWRFGLGLLLVACAPEASRNLGDPRGGWKQQDQQNEAPLARASDMPDAGPGAFSVLAANVGNIDVLSCDSAIYKLCNMDQERRIATAIAKARPDIALLSEVITPEQCDALGATVDAGHVCAPENRAASPDQVRRLLGPEYTIACEPRRGFECIGVRRGFATMEGCAEGALCRGLLRTTPPVDGCDDGFTLDAITVKFDDQRVDLVVGHPPSGFGAPERECRRQYLVNALGDESSLRKAPLAIVGGDLNMDPWRHAEDVDAQYFWSRVRAQRSAGNAPFVLHSGLAENNPPYWSATLNRATWDHVFSTGFIGRCVTLGAAANYPPLDAPQGEEIHRLDHFAQYCVLSAEH